MARKPKEMKLEVLIYLCLATLYVTVCVLTGKFAKGGAKDLFANFFQNN